MVLVRVRVPTFGSSPVMFGVHASELSPVIPISGKSGPQDRVVAKVVVVLSLLHDFNALFAMQNRTAKSSNFNVGQRANLAYQGESPLQSRSDCLDCFCLPINFLVRVSCEEAGYPRRYKKR